MANTNLKFACVLVLFLILHQQHLYVQGRHLRSQLCRLRGCSKAREIRNIVVAHGVGDRDDTHQESKRRVEYQVDDFRPTSPGHSPGVGHTINN